MKPFLKLLICILGCELVGIAGTPFTISGIPTWYQFLNKPVFSPPSWVFGPVWTILYFMMGMSLYLIWKKGVKNKKAKRGITYFLIQLILNFSWSIVFFGLHEIFLAFLVIIGLWIFILLCIVQFKKIDTRSSYLLIPYFFWVSFASSLNLSIVLLNR